MLIYAAAADRNVTSSECVIGAHRQHPWVIRYMKKLLALIAIAALAGTACTVAGSATPRSAPTPVRSPVSTADPCAASAAAYNGHVAGLFVTTVGAIRAVPMLSIQSDRWPGLPDSHPAVLCYIDGQIPKGPPPQPLGTVPPSFDRAVIAVIDGQPDLIMAGYRDNLPVVAP